MQDLKVVRLHRLEGDSKTKAFADIAIGDVIVKGWREVSGHKGVYLAMPREKSKDGKWYDNFYAATDEAKLALQELVLSEFEK